MVSKATIVTMAATALAEAAGRVFPHAGYTAAAPVRKAAEDAASFRAQLDDMAQMIGPRLIAVAGEEKAVLAALKRFPVVATRHKRRWPRPKQRWGLRRS